MDSHRGFRARFPAVRLNTAVLYVDGGQILTSAGNAASADLALHILRADYGAEVANTIARHMVIPSHRRGGQAQYVETPVAVRPEAGDRLAATLEWAMQRLSQPLPVKALAAYYGLSPRQFTRQFRQATGTTPHQWLLTQRLALARRLLPPDVPRLIGRLTRLLQPRVPGGRRHRGVNRGYATFAWPAVAGVRGESAARRPVPG